jgi:hypothetical protein
VRSNLGLLRACISLAGITLLTMVVHAAPGVSAQLVAKLQQEICSQSPQSQKEAESANLFAAFKTALEKDELALAFSRLQKISAANQCWAAQKLCCRIQSQMFARQNALARELKSQVAELLAKTGEVCLRATRAEQLEPAIAELGLKRETLAQLDCATARETLARFEKAVAFAQLWQKYLDRRSTDLLEAKAQLIYLANIDISHLMIDRSRLLAESEQIIVDEDAASPPQAPGDLVTWRNSDGSSELSWVNNSEASDMVILQKQHLDGKWEVLAELLPNVTTFHIPSPVSQVSL